MQERVAEIRRILAGMNKRYLLFALLAFLIFIGLSVGRCTEVHAPVAEQAAQAENAPQQTQAALSPEQEALYNAYNDETHAFLDLLCANIWTAGNDQKALHFSDKGFKETDGGKENEGSFAVSALETASETESGVNGESTTVTTYSAALLTDGGTKLLTLRQFNDNAGQGSSASVTSSAFQFSESYVLSEAASGVSVTGLGSGFDNLIDGKSDELSKAVQDYCSSRYPTASTAAWSSTATVDYANGNISTSFELDNDAKTVVWVTYHPDSKTFEVS